MGAWLLPAVTTAVGAISAIGQRRRKGPNVREINSRYSAMRPGGYLTPEDMAMAERTRTKGVATARRGAELGREGAMRQVRARGLSGASAASLLTEVGNTEAANRESAFGAATDQELGLYGQNRDFEREKLFKGWGAELGDAAQQASINGQREAGLWNSILGTAPLIADAWGKMPTGAVPSAGAPGYLQGYAEGQGGVYNPSVKPRY